jgi:hypothetical protein
MTMTTKGIDWKPGVEIDWQTTDYVVVPPVWAEDLPLEGIHCHYNVVKGEWVASAYPHAPCTSWKYHAQRRGKTPFLRFIHAFTDQLNGLPNPFSGSDSILIIDPGRSVTSNGRRASCEIYLARNEADWKVAFRIFLIRTNKVSVIECLDERYLEACKAARAAVDQGYLDEEENIGWAPSQSS